MTADYDVDGFLDLFVTNGLLYFPFGAGGPDTMLHNRGNSNRWIEIDLVGQTSNRDGVGAKVFVTAGGLTQLREQNGGYHRWSQNHQRLHFGLAGNQTVSAIRVEWPSGRIDNYTNVASNRLYKARENGPLDPVTLGPPVHTQLLPNDECGQPPYHLDYGPVVLMWRDCPGGVWHVRAKGGREEARQLWTEGKIVADAPFGGVTPFQLGGQNKLTTSVPNEISFSIFSWFTNDRGFDFNTAGQSSACFGLSRLDAKALIVGSSKKRITAPFNLLTRAACTLPPPPPPPGPECGQPSYTASSQPGLYAWRDCNFSTTTRRWIFRAVGGGLGGSTYAGQITGNAALAATAPFSLENNDKVDTTPGDNIIDFSMITSGAGQDGFQVDVPGGSSACFSTSSLPAGTTVMIGANKQVMSAAFDLVTLQACTPPPPPPGPGPECGTPTFDKATEVGVFVWRDCTASGPDQLWQVRVTGGGTANSTYSGLVTSNVVLSATGVGLETNDRLNTVPDDFVIDFDLLVGGTGQDGFQFGKPAGAPGCFDATQVKPGAQIQLGKNRMPMGQSFNLVTLGACN